jgi:hypothetical protein
VEYVVDSLQYARQTKGPVLECGSGLSTLLLGIVAQCSGNVVWTLEHNQMWGDNVKKILQNMGSNQCACASTSFVIMMIFAGMTLR